MMHLVLFLIIVSSATSSILTIGEDSIFTYSLLVFVFSTSTLIVIDNTRIYRALVVDLDKDLFYIKKTYVSPWEVDYILTHKTSGQIITAYGDKYQPLAFVRMKHLEDPILPYVSGWWFLRKVHARYMKKNPPAAEESFPWRNKDEKS